MEEINLVALCKAVGGELVNVRNDTLAPIGVSIDTRDNLNGKIFIPLKGEKTDGHNYLSHAFKSGAIFSISEVSGDFPHIKVNSTYSAIKDFAKYYKSLFNIPTIGITGSVGKTTTKDLTASIVSQGFKTLKTQGNFNNEIGLPLTIFNIDNSTHACVLEMGMNNLKEIHNLANIARPTIALITNIGVSHIENLGSRENILKAKLEILDFNPKEVILDGDNDMLATLKDKINGRYYYLNDPLKDYTAYNIIHNGLINTSATIKILNEEFRITIPIPGDYMVRNALAGAIIGKIMGLSNEQIKLGIETFKPSKNRMDIKKISDLTIINDTYNASPQSMKAMLDLLSSQKGKKVAILGDMFELGDFAEGLHIEVGEYYQVKNLDYIISIGELAKNIYIGAKKYENNGVKNFYFKSKDQFFSSNLITEFGTDTILVKASRGMYFEEIIDHIESIFN